MSLFALGFSAQTNERGLQFSDHCDHGVVVKMLLNSRMPGTCHSTHQQWDTIWKLQTACDNGVRASGAVSASVTSACDGEGDNFQQLSNASCAPLWFMQFVTGHKRWMGHCWRPDQAMTPQLMQRLLAQIDDRIVDLAGKANEAECHCWSCAGTCFAMSQVISL